MFKRTILAALLLSAPAAAQELDGLKAEGAKLIKTYADSLKDELSAALQAGGPSRAIEVCRAQAPAIAAKVSAESGWTVRRTSHRIRNAASAPDAYESRVLDEFLARLAKGEGPASLMRAEVVDEGGGKVFRLVKAIPIQDMCLDCHGTQIDPWVRDRLRAAYPDDAATGFKLGDIRGVFSLKKPL